MALTMAVIHHARMRPLQACYLQWENRVPLQENCCFIISTKTAMMVDNKRTFRDGNTFSLVFIILITTEAKKTGRQSHCRQKNNRCGQFRRGNITCFLEHLAFFKPVRALESLIAVKALQVATDNTTAMCYVNKEEKQGGRTSMPLL